MVTLPRSLSLGRASTTETGDEACRGVPGVGYLPLQAREEHPVLTKQVLITVGAIMQ